MEVFSMKNKYLLGILENVKKKDANEPEFIFHNRWPHR